MNVLAVIVTYRRPDWLIRCIQSAFKAAENAPIELRIKVGINGEDPLTLAALNLLNQSLPLADRARLQFEQLENGLTPGKARNLLIENEKSDWIYFIDDDAFIVDTGLFAKFKKTAEENPQVGVIGGPNLTPSGSSYFQKNLGAALSSRFATFKTVDRYYASGQSRPCGEEALILCNLFVRMSILPSHPFPTDLICGEENHLLRKLSRQGVEMIHSPELSVAHERRSSLSKLVKQVFHYGVSRGKSMANDPKARHWAYALPSVCILTALILSAKWALALNPSPTLMVLATLYLFLAVAAAIRARVPGTSVVSIAALFFWIHLSYGLGVISGVTRR